MSAESRATTHLVHTTSERAGTRLDLLVATVLPRLSRTRAKALIEAGHVALLSPARSPALAPAEDRRETIAEPSYRVKSGQSFAIFIPDTLPAEPRAQSIALDIVYEDADLLVIDKPAGLVVHPAPGNREGTLVNALIAHCGESLLGVGGVRRPGIVHRLDKDTSGLMVVAKTDAAHGALAAQFADHTIDRRYAAVVWGVPAPAEGVIQGAIGRHPRNRKKMAVVARGGKPARTFYRVRRVLGASRRGLASVVSCRLETGRTHQVRVHLATIGHPVIGDPVYGGGLTPARRHGMDSESVAALGRMARQALHAERLGFRHPTSGRQLEFFSEFPVDIRHLVNYLETI